MWCLVVFECFLGILVSSGCIVGGVGYFGLSVALLRASEVVLSTFWGVVL